MLSNKNLVVAILVAPVLSILGWWAMGEFIGEKPRSAQEGQSYPLLEKSSCRYASGLCELENVDFKLVLSYREDNLGPYILVNASHSLQGILMAVGPGDSELTPGAMNMIGEQGTQWRMSLDSRPDPQARIRLVARVAGSTWFGDASTHFLQPAVDGVMRP
jgi:hypothetical protein